MTPEQQGTVFGLFHMLGSLARVIGPTIAGLIYTLHHTSPYFTAGTITALVMVWTVGLWRAYGSEQTESAPVIPESAG